MTYAYPVIVSAWNGRPFTHHDEVLHVAVDGDIDSFLGPPNGVKTRTACNRQMWGAFLPTGDGYTQYATLRLCQVCRRRSSPETVYDLHGECGAAHVPVVCIPTYAALWGVEAVTTILGPCPRRSEP